MLTGIRQRLTDDEGLTLVEVLVAMVVLGITLTALTATLITSLRAVVSNESRVRANALANEILEGLRNEPWDDLVAGTTTDTQDIENVTYSAETEISWVDDPSTSDPEDYLRFTVTVEWDILGVTRSVVHEAFRARPPGEPSEFAIRSIAADPEIGYLQDDPDDRGKLVMGVTVDEDGEIEPYPATKVDLTVVMTSPVDTVTVSFRPRNASSAVTRFLSSADGGITWEISLEPSYRYRNGDTTFEFEATVVGNPLTATAPKVARFVNESVSMIAADAVEVCVDADRRGEEDVEVEGHFRGLSIDDSVQVSGANIADGAADFREADEDTGTAIFTYTIPAGHEYPDEPTAAVTMTGTRSLDGATGEGDVELLLYTEDDDECGS